MISRPYTPPAWLRSPWVIAGIALQLIASLSATWIFWARHLWFQWMMPIVEHFNPNIDAPDNWAMAATYSFRLIIALIVLGFLCYFAGLITFTHSGHAQQHAGGDS